MFTSYNVSKKAYEVELSLNDISDKAFEFYSNTEPICILTDVDRTKFTVTGCFKFSVNSLTELEKAFEALADEITEDDEEGDED